MTGASIPEVTWDERMAARSPAVRRSRLRTMKQARMILDAARRLAGTSGDSFTTQELAKEAGVAVQTFYSYFASKDELLLAVIGDMLSDFCAQWAEAAKDLPDPIARLHFYITSTLGFLDGTGDELATTRFIVSTHSRLHRIFPDELAAAQQPFVDLLLTEIRAGVSAGLLDTDEQDWDAWFLLELIRSVYHHYTYATPSRKPEVKEQLWRFCLKAIGGSRQ